MIMITHAEKKKTSFSFLTKFSHFKPQKSKMNDEYIYNT